MDRHAPDELQEAEAGADVVPGLLAETEQGAEVGLQAVPPADVRQPARQSAVNSTVTTRRAGQKQKLTESEQVKIFRVPEFY